MTQGSGGERRGNAWLLNLLVLFSTGIALAVALMLYVNWAFSPWNQRSPLGLLISSSVLLLLGLLGPIISMVYAHRSIKLGAPRTALFGFSLAFAVLAALIVLTVSAALMAAALFN